ncbi:hypothetical protein C8Q80DRAFT_410590 [Daedaleopsis nitida]|nr:hypothetical protein C8Q80DRAFT_410590 [Daedaleopsis nitida]
MKYGLRCMLLTCRGQCLCICGPCEPGIKPSVPLMTILGGIISTRNGAFRTFQNVGLPQDQRLQVLLPGAFDIKNITTYVTSNIVPLEFSVVPSSGKDVRSRSKDYAQKYADAPPARASVIHALHRVCRPRRFSSGGFSGLNIKPAQPTAHLQPK